MKASKTSKTSRKGRRRRKKGVISMSGAGGVGGVGGSGGAHATPTPTAAQSSDAVTPAKGASGVSDDGGKDSLTIGDGNLIGNTQNQTIHTQVFF